MSARRWLLLIAAAGLIALFLGSDLPRLLSFETVKAHQAEALAWRHAHPAATVLGFVLAYAVVGTLPIPGAVLVTVMAGALFGVLGGVLIASVLGSLGAGLGFLVARFLLRDRLHRRYAAAAERVDAGLRRDGPFYLFTLRLLPVLPFFLINFSFGLSTMRLRQFYWISQLGMVPSALVFANAGRELATLDSLHGVLSPGLLASFALIAAFPWLARAAVGALQRRSVS